MPKFWRHTLSLCAFGLIFTACTSPAGSRDGTATPVISLIPYQTSSPAATIAVEQAEAAGSSSTPHIYTVVEGDTFFSIAANLGISLDALIAANPDVDARLLSPGAELLIPAVGAEGTAIPSLPTPTPVPVHMGDTNCYSTAAGELWCFISVRNEGEQTIENLSGFVHLLSADGDVLETVEAVAPLNILTNVNGMLLVAYFDDPPDGWTSARGQLLSANLVPAGDETYLDAQLQEADIDISASGMSARVLGEVDLQNAEVIWVLAVAYDAYENVIGVRRWESTGVNEFSFTVYSLGPQIEAVELLVEARP